ncbi:hypothetical protein DPX39_040079800 [Trypanosoma brucei equiperdum]|uniref:Uncharacterized protein n=1 Tax=Trypanosoma brucei equiperdum TaxID=630700 RepID=A0A3L6L939_9TRYP|nr:hypothetical protein DPX39_040079800 [Trypanosoma brucei equiperdum]
MDSSSRSLNHVASHNPNAPKYVSMERVGVAMLLFILFVVILTCIVFIIFVYLIRNNHIVLRLFTNGHRPPDALPPPAVLCETRRLRALGGGVNGAVLIGDENRQLLSALDIPLTPVPSLCEDCKELCRSSSNCSTLDIAINDGCLATRECAKESAVLGAHDCGKCQLGYPKRIRDLSTDRVFELYISQPSSALYGSAQYITIDKEPDASVRCTRESSKLNRRASESLGSICCARTPTSTTKTQNMAGEVFAEPFSSFR